MATTPDTLGHYKVQRVLGKGAMGVVYEALDARLHRRVAIKTIQKTDFGDWSAREFSSRFLREAQAVARLNHPNIVQVYDFGEDEKLAFIVMEFIDGKDLKTHFEQSGRFELRNALRIMCQLLDALDFAHQAGVVHRDIKPANVMLDGQSRTKLTDFGVARLTDQDRSGMDSTQVGTIVGTPAYMSPEQVLGQKIDGRSDIFSAGVLLYEFLTGKKPFEGGAFTLAKMIIEADPPPPSSLEGSIPPELDLIVTRTMAKNPDYRFATAREAAAAIRRYLSRGSVLEFDDGSTVLASGAFAGAREAPLVQPDEPSRPPTRPPQGKTQSSEADLEFWRSIRDSDDHEDLELYVRTFPDGIYVDLAKRKIAKLRRAGPGLNEEDSGARSGKFDEEYWRSIKDSTDPDDLELYLRKFPDGTFAELAKRRLAKLRRGITDTGGLASGARTQPDLSDPGPEAEWRARRAAEDEAKRDVEWRAEEKARRAAEDAAREAREAEAKARREAEEIARREAAEVAARELARQQAELARQKAEAQAIREAEEKARREAEERAQLEAQAQAQREAEEKAQREAEIKARREAEEKAKREAEEKARREAEQKAKAAALAALELARQQAEAAKREAEQKARHEADAKARREAEEAAKRVAEAKAKYEAEERARREAQELAKRQAQEVAAREVARRQAEAAKVAAEETARREAQARATRATVSARRDLDDEESLARQEPGRETRRALLVGVVVAALAVGAGGVYFAMQKPAKLAVDQPVATPPTSKATDLREPPKAAVTPPAKADSEPPATAPALEKPEVVAPSPPPETAKPTAKANDRLNRDSERTKREAAEKSTREAAEKARRDAEQQQAVDARRAQGERASREAEQRQNAAELAKREAEDAARLEGERRRAREELQRVQNELRARTDELNRQKLDAERQKADTDRPKGEAEKPRPRIVVPPSM